MDLIYGNSKEITAVVKSSVKASDLSRYRSCMTLTVAGNSIKSALKPDQMVIDLSDAVSYTVKAGEANRMDKIAYNLYGNASLFWVICFANGIKDPMSVKAGQVLLVPSSSSLYSSSGILGVS